ncbi:MAG: hypothetical protein HYY23_12550 [Verrucomicrobia bacterium]|nr:hypothetical protein [Verrucomicrobiota bacterium]
MTSSKNLVRLGSILALGLSAFSPAHAQVTISSRDMFNQIGQYYRAYANKGSVSVSGKLGVAGGPQVWDFTSGPSDQVYRFDYVAATDGDHGADFPNAKFAERKTEEANGTRNWLYLEQVPGVGRKVYGFYDADANPNKPSVKFSEPIVDFPEIINYKDTWTTSTSYQIDIATFSEPDPEDPTAPPEEVSISAVFKVTSTFSVDAHGLVNLPNPNIGFGEALRVNELVQYDVEVDLFGDGQFQPVTQQFSRNYYWLRSGYGIVAQVNSREQSTAPPDNFTTATSFIRLFETNRSGVPGERPVAGITGLKITVTSGRILINWDKANAGLYRVEYTTNPGQNDSWSKLGETKEPFLLDSISNSTTARFYRVVGVAN